MAYDTTEARQELVDSVAESVDELSKALAAIGAAYERLDEQSGDVLEEALFGPVQAAYGRAKRTITEFAARHGHAEPEFTTAEPVGPPSKGAKDFLLDAEDGLIQAEAILTELQDSLSPVEVGDPELRAGLADVRGRLDGLADRAAEGISRFGR